MKKWLLGIGIALLALCVVVAAVVFAHLQKQVEEVQMVILQQPAISLTEDAQIYISLSVEGEDLSYQWYEWVDKKQDYVASSQTESVYYPAKDETPGEYKVYCVVTDKYGNTLRSDVVSYTVKPSETETIHTHSFVAEEIPATCTRDGVSVFQCDCGEEYTEEKKDSKLPHSFTQYQKNNNATCTADGTETAKCDHCDASDIRKITGSKLSHSFTQYQKDNNATCTADGTETAKCDRCAATKTRKVEGSKLSHSFTNYRSDNNATCAADGTETAKCDRCTATKTRTAEGSKLPHSFTNYRGNNDATCTADGTETAKCDHCTATDTRTDVDSKGHNYVSGTCSKCGDTPVGVKITKQPSNTTVVAGMAGSVSIAATGDGLTYEWYYKDATDSSFRRASATGSSYTITMIDSADGRKAYCIVRDKYGNSVQSQTITFTKKVTSSGDGATGEDGDIFIPFN